MTVHTAGVSDGRVLNDYEVKGECMRSILVVAAASAALVSGCATKNYGRLQPLTPIEAQVYDCQGVEVEIAKVEAFRQQVAEGAKFNGASVMGFLGDYGIGNANERNNAERTATQRMNQLLALRAQKGCYAGAARTPVAPAPQPDQRSPTPTAAPETPPRPRVGNSSVRCITC